MSIVTAIYAALFGGAIGSYAGVVAARGLRRSITGRSRCDACGRSLEWFELIPIVSFLALRRRCRTCKAEIGWSPMVWELAGAVLLLLVVVPVEIARGS